MEQQLFHLRTSLMTTKPEEVEKREKEMEAEKHEGNR